VVNRRLTDRSIAGLRALALGLGAATLALLTQVLAQEPFAATPLRGTVAPSLASSDNLAGTPATGLPPGQPPSGVLAPFRATTALGQAGRAAPGQLGRRARFRRSRSPTAAIVRQPTQLPTASPNVAIDVQPLQVGIPDPPQAAALPGRASTVSTTIGAREEAPRATFGAGQTTVLPLALRGRRLVQADPYGPVGVRLGSTFLFFPTIEQSFGYDDNPNRASGQERRGSAVSRTEAELRLQSDWSRHELSGFVRGAYSVFPDVAGADRPDAEGRITLRLDASRDTQLDAETHFRIDTERPGNPNLSASVAERPINSLVGGSTGVTHRFNRLSIGLRGTLDREDFEDARLGDGTIIDQSDRAVTQFGVRMRAAYEVNPGLIPFAEGVVDTRVHDLRIDRSGFRRDSDGVAFRAGTSFEITRTLTGEVSGGIQARVYDDPRLETLVGPLVEASVLWSASPLTTVRLRGQSTIEETTLPFSSGATTQSATLEVQHDLRRNLSVVAAVSASDTRYDGVRLEEQTLTGTVRIDYRLTRSVALRASFTHERLKSTSPGADYTANVFLVGLRFQR